jgi:hypothetical protein
VAVLPSGASISPGATQQFTVYVSNVANPVITWYVNAIRGGNATVGTINAAGLYTAPNAPPSQPTVKITATHTSDALGSGSVALTVAYP